MAANVLTTNTPIKTPNPKNHSNSSARRVAPPSNTTNADSSSSSATDLKSRFEAYNRLQAAAFAFGEKLPIPEIVAIGGQSDGKSSLLEALLGFRFNVREVEMGTRRPLVLQMVHDPSSLEPRCRFQDEDSEEYGGSVVSGTAIADLIRSRTEAHLRKMNAAVSSKPIVMRAEYAHCPNLTIIDTPGFVLKAKKGEPENTPDEILSMVKALASPPHRLLLFLQQSSVEWCSSLWLDSIREIDPTFKRTIIVVSKFDNRLKEFNESWEVDRYLSASGYLGDNIHPFFVALPKDRGTVTNEEFRRQISQVDIDILHHLRQNVKGGFNEEKFEPFIGFGSLRKFLECELQKRYKEAAPATLALLEQRCSEVSSELGRIEYKLQATSDISHLRKSAMLHTASICTHVGALIDGAADPAPEQWGKSSVEEQQESGFGSWPGVNTAVKPPNCNLRLYGGAAFERVMHEFRCATYSIECPPVSREKVANILLAHAGRGGGGGVVEAAAEIARAAARAWFAPILDTACERLAFVLRCLFELAAERNRNHDSDYWKKNGDMDGYIGFHAALRRSYHSFVNDLSKHCKQLVRHHLDSVTSPYSQVCYEPDFMGGIRSGSSPYSTSNQLQSISYFLDLSDPGGVQEEMDQENVPPKNLQNKTPGKKMESMEALKESQMTIPETPSPDLPIDAAVLGVRKKENGNCLDVGGRKRQARTVNTGRNSDAIRNQNSGLLFVDIAKSGSSYIDICSLAAQHFARIREVLIERSVSSALNSGFLTPCRERLIVALGLELFAVTDEKFMDMFVAPSAIDVLQSERLSLQKREKILRTCLNEFKNIARAL
ncbi:dynamin-related protein 5A [Phalaenopsis equestris]|uniref:dynamin-related protein 5A n=2 Tax=Phalaenopsis equestris TaxID=78828 RepID=UPI0009E3F624|nr:dynamin-related protein 5A [Phalaenopsis equestris]